MADYRDPAIRLHNIVTKVHPIDGKATIRDGWSKVLDLDEVSDAELLRTLGKLMGLPSQIRDEFDHRGIPPSPTLDSLHKIEKALGFLNLNRPDWQKVKDHVTEDALQGLLIASHRELSRELPEQDIPESDLESLTGKVREAIDEALDVDTDPRLQRFVVDHLRMVEQAIQDYRIDGGEAFGRIIRCAAGEVVLDQQVRDAHIRREPILARFWRTVGHVASVLTVATTLAGTPVEPAEVPAIVVEQVEVNADMGDEPAVSVIRDDLLDAIQDLAERPALEAGTGNGADNADQRGTDSDSGDEASTDEHEQEDDSEDDGTQ